MLKRFFKYLKSLISSSTVYKNKCEEDSYGNKYWENDKGESHRIDGPAIELYDGYKSWWINGGRHRLNGPAIEWSNGKKAWYINENEITGINDFMDILC